MDEALIEDAENEINHQNAHDQEEPQPLEGGLEGLGSALEAGGDGARQDFPGRFRHRLHPLA